MRTPSFDYALVGGGLQNALLALALAEAKPSARVALIERDSRLGGNHTWCFHAGDVPADAASFVEPLVARRWPAYTVRFPGYERRLDAPYGAVTSAGLHATLLDLARRSPSFRLYLGESATRIETGSVELASGTSVRAHVVVDARGPEAFEYGCPVGFQKFLGLELYVDPACVPEHPIIIDALVPQTDGFRFFYVLPVSRECVLVEETFFSDSPSLDRPACRAEVADYARNAGLRVGGVAREETGVLPLPTRPFSAPASLSGLVVGGYRGGWFHPTTGYSFPLAVRFAREVARAPARELIERLEALERERARQQRFCTLLNRLLFEAFQPEARMHVFERFYRLPAPLVSRFYALALTPADRLRILCGRPPRGFRTDLLFSGPRRAILSPQPAGENS